MSTVLFIIPKLLFLWNSNYAKDLYALGVIVDILIYSMYLLFQVFLRYCCDNIVKPRTPKNQCVIKNSISLSLMGLQLH